MGIGRPVSLTSSIASKIVTATATAGQTSFTVTGGYNINQLAVFRNGVRLVNGSDYTAIDGATVTLLSAASVGDQLEFQVLILSKQLMLFLKLHPLKLLMVLYQQLEYLILVFSLQEQM